MDIDSVSRVDRTSGNLLSRGLGLLGYSVPLLPVGRGCDGAVVGQPPARPAGSAVLVCLGAALARLLHQDADTPAPPDRP
jgi:hypothetical protein